MILYHAKSVNRWKITEVFEAIRQADLFISGGGSLIQDVSSNYGFFYYIFLIALAKLLKKPVMIYAQGLGPLQTRLAQKATAFVFKRCNAFSFRDKNSLQLFQKLSKTNNGELVFDPVLAYVGKNDTPILSQDSKKKKILFALRPWENLSPSIFAHALDELAKTYDLYLLPMHKDVDKPFGELIQNEMSESCTLLDSGYILDELMTLFNEVDGVVAMRLHGLIIGANLGKPLLSISYDPKCDSFMEMLGEESLLSVSNLTKDNLVYAVNALFDKAPLYLEQLPKCKALAKKSAQIALSLVKKS